MKAFSLFPWEISICPLSILSFLPQNTSHIHHPFSVPPVNTSKSGLITLHLAFSISFPVAFFF